jgi:hypothetical protein
MELEGALLGTANRDLSHLDDPGELRL